MINMVWRMLLVGGILEVVCYGKCPNKCFCDNSTLIAHCSKKALQSLPETFPKVMAEANFNFNPFNNPILTRRNMTLFSNLTNLYLGGCHIKHITENTFYDMKNLQILDLSENQITLIQENTFRGLQLNHLFLHSNKMIVLTASSFQGLSTKGLHLHGCSLTSLPFNVFQPFQNSLTNLWLDDNFLTHIDVRFQDVFQKLHHLRLNGNPFKCDCRLSWLKDFFESNPGKFKDVKPISCGSSMAEKSITQMSSTAFECKAPTFHNINAFFDLDRAILKCSASGNPTPTLFWIQPNGKTIKYESSSFKSMSSEWNQNDEIEAVLRLHTNRHYRNPHRNNLHFTAFTKQIKNASLECGMYICVANNQVGNVTLMVNVTWPLGHRFSSTKHTKKHYESANQKPNDEYFQKSENRKNNILNSPLLTNINKEKDLNQINDLNDEHNYKEKNKYNNNYHNNHIGQHDESKDISEISKEIVIRKGIFSLAEMVVAIIATHLLTIAFVLCLLVVRNVILRTRRQKSRYVDEPQINSSGPLISTNARVPTHAIIPDPTYDKVDTVFSDVYNNSSVSNVPRFING